ncbi:MAG TPA: zf-HC2 domain-containing protein, partial [bacterium]|nr:zf-HC2 domain-containing protein [bacterium]
MGGRKHRSQCAEITELTLPYLNRQLSTDLAQAVEEHLRRCSACRQEYSLFQELKRLDFAKEQGAVDPDVIFSTTGFEPPAVTGNVPTVQEIIREIETIHSGDTADERARQREMIYCVHRFLINARGFLQSRRVVRAGREWMKLERRLAKLLRRILNHPSAALLVPVMHLQAEAYVSRGLIFQLQGDMTHAEHNLSQSVVILWAMNDPEALQTQRFLGELKFYEGDLASADELFASAL